MPARCGSCASPCTTMPAVGPNGIPRIAARMRPETMANDTFMERIEDEAALWAARLRGGGMTDADRAALASWLDADPEHRWVLGRYREITFQLDTQLATALDSLAVTGAATRQRRRRFLVASLGLATAAMVAWMIAVPRAKAFSTKIAERHVAL